MSNIEKRHLTRSTFASVAATGALSAMAPAVAAAALTNGGDAYGGIAPARHVLPNRARLAISISLMFERDGRPISGAGGAVPEPIKPGYPDQVTNAFFDYGLNEGIPRALDLSTSTTARSRRS